MQQKKDQPGCLFGAKLAFGVDRIAKLKTLFNPVTQTNRDCGAMTYECGEC